MCVRGANNVATLPSYTLMITEQKFDQFQTPKNSEKHTTMCNMVCKRTQHVTLNNVGSCCMAILRPFTRTFTPTLPTEVLYQREMLELRCLFEVLCLLEVLPSLDEVLYSFEVHCSFEMFELLDKLLMY